MAVTLADLLTRVRRIADIEDDGVFMPNVELIEHVNSACWALDDVLHATWEDYYTKTVETTFQGKSHALPADFYKLVAVDIRLPNGKWVDVKPFALKARNDYRNSADTRPEATRYRVESNSLSLLPGYTSPVTAAVTYYPKVAPLVNLSDTRDYPNGWEQWAVLKAAILALTKEERDTSGLDKLFLMEDARVRQAAPIRNAMPVQIVGTDGGERRGPWASGDGW